MTNTHWQHYEGETTLSQMVGLAVQSPVSAAADNAVAVGFLSVPLVTSLVRASRLTLKRTTV
jgi:K+-transporting ATPase A subunit